VKANLDLPQIPYFDIESRTSFEQSKSRNQLLLSGYGDLHITPSLDQSYYLGLIDTRTRDDDQVITKVLDSDLRRSRPIQGADLLFQFLADHPVSQHPGGAEPKGGVREATEPGQPIASGAEAGSKEKGLQLEANPGGAGEGSIKSQTRANGAKNEEAVDRSDDQRMPVDICSQVELQDNEQHVDGSRLLMVPQLWLWKLDSRTSISSSLANPFADGWIGTIITTCPERAHGGDESTNDTLFKSLRRGLEEMEQLAESTTSPDCFIAFVVQHCISFFSNPLNAGLKDSAALLFARYIAMQVFVLPTDQSPSTLETASRPLITSPPNTVFEGSRVSTRVSRLTGGKMAVQDRRDTSSGHPEGGTVSPRGQRHQG